MEHSQNHTSKDGGRILFNGILDCNKTDLNVRFIKLLFINSFSVTLSSQYHKNPCDIKESKCYFAF